MKEKIKQILREDINNGPTKLSVFDFDATLVDTGMPETHKMIYKEKTGEDWPHRGWWGRPESLDTDVFDFKALSSKAAYKDELNKSNVLTIIATGRRDKLKGHVLNVLKNLGFQVNPNNLYCNDKSDTFTFKVDKFDTILDANPSIREVELWDDRHINEFQNWGQSLVDSGRLKNFKINHIK